MTNFRPQYKSNPSYNRFQALSDSSSPRPKQTLVPYEPQSPQISSESPLSYKNLFSTKLADFPSLPSPSTATSSSKQPTSSSTQYNWIEKLTSPVIEIEEEHDNKSYKELFDLYFFKNQYYVSDNPMKTREWYEAILIFTESIDIEHNMKENRDHPGQEFISFSKCRIKQIHSMKTWKARSLITPLAFPTDSQMTPQTFNYYDYSAAWTNFLLIKPFSHTWFIQIKTDLPDPVPRWFFHWWTKFGINADILTGDLVVCV